MTDLHAEHTLTDHRHGADCGHQTIEHGDHVDYLHGTHRHAEHDDHYDEHESAAEHSVTEHQHGSESAGDGGGCHPSRLFPNTFVYYEPLVW